jgi:hypothetical protein
MAQIWFKQPPEGTIFKTYRHNTFSFEYPSEGHVVVFERGDLPGVVRVLYDAGDKRHRFNIERYTRAGSAQKAATLAYEGAAERMRGNVRPFKLDHVSDGWRCRKRFANGGQTPVVIDTAFIQRGPALYRLNFLVQVEDYEETQWVFDMLVRTFAPTHLQK